MRFFLKTFFSFNPAKTSCINTAKNIQHTDLLHFDDKINLHMSKISIKLVVENERETNQIHPNPFLFNI